MISAEQIQREIERGEADLRVATLDETTAVPTAILPAPMPGSISSRQGRLIVQRDYEGWWSA